MPGIFKRSNTRLIASLVLVLSAACAAQNTPGAGEEPIIASFSADPTEIPLGATSTLAWRVSGATSLSLAPAIGAVEGSSLVVQLPQTTTYTLTAMNAAGSATATATVTVRGNGDDSDNGDDGAGCSRLNGAQVLSGVLTLAYSGSGQSESGAVSVERQADVTVTFGRTPYPHLESTAITGSASIRDTYTSSSLNDEITGSGNPLQEPSSITLNADCTVERARVVVSVEAQNSTIPGAATSTVGVIHLENVPLDGSAELPASTWSSGTGSFVALEQGQQYTEGFANFLRMILGDDNMGTAAVTWSFSPAK